MLLIEAIIKNDITTVKKLLEKGVDPNFCEDKAGITPLHFAAQNNTMEIVKLLIAAGADVTIKNEEGLTAFDIAVILKNREIMDFLRKI
jgi:ankyrin repeat protein